MKSYGNAFELIASDLKEVESYTNRSNMMSRLLDLINSNGWSQKEAAQFLGVPESLIKRLKSGSISEIKESELINILERVDSSISKRKVNNV